MSGTGSIDPTREQFKAFMQAPQNTPIHMLNLIRLRAEAAYPPEHPNHGKGMTGLDAYREYGRASAPIFKRVGGRQVWAGRPEVVLTGPPDERWDIAFIAQFPNSLAFAELIRDPQYKEHVKHRQAAVEDSRLIRFFPLEPGERFGEADAPENLGELAKTPGWQLVTGEATKREGTLEEVAMVAHARRTRGEHPGIIRQIGTAIELEMLQIEDLWRHLGLPV